MFVNILFFNDLMIVMTLMILMILMTLMMTLMIVEYADKIIMN